jgi:hypothetical protein
MVVLAEQNARQPWRSTDTLIPIENFVALCFRPTLLMRAEFAYDVFTVFCVWDSNLGVGRLVDDCGNIELCSCSWWSLDEFSCLGLCVVVGNWVLPKRSREVQFEAFAGW